MVSLVCFILSLCNVCAFDWLPILIDLGLISILLFFKSKKQSVLWWITMGGAFFALLKCFFGMSVSAWWIFLFPLVFFVLVLVPGGFTLFGLLMNHLELLCLPAWGLTVALVIDILLLTFTILDWVAGYKEQHTVR